MAGKTARSARTQSFIDAFREADNEAAILKAFIGLMHGGTYEDSQRFEALIDTSIVAERIKTLNEAQHRA
ncbi:hypothetical protein [Burkholderia vietnamiensis]|uniref:hypothetical protein n=1 Tax=Burkholderia vietnamiensis TaxID=60552 RepID=UPI001CF322DB|nr:hypothetical protein [Burkholderia vietnamiensis]MCA8448994.1 hypothetical protein [Burkholderia vietnamiensis]